MDDFNSHLEQHAVSVPSLEIKPAAREADHADEFVGHFIQTGTNTTNHWLFKAYKEESIEKNKSKQDTVLEASIIATFGGLNLVDPNLDKQHVVLRISTEHVYYQIERGDQIEPIVCTAWHQVKW
jgi:hypothetical protein